MHTKSSSRLGLERRAETRSSQEFTLFYRLFWFTPILRRAVLRLGSLMLVRQLVAFGGGVALVGGAMFVLHLLGLAGGAR